MNPLVIILIGIVAPPVARLVAASIDNLAAEIERLNLGPTDVGTVTEIIQGVARTHWDAAKKHDMVRAATAQFLANHGRPFTDEAVDALLAAALAAQVRGAGGKQD